ncbi:hypothetical protein ABN075_22040, partial [Providencia rettgeri]
MPRPPLGDHSACSMHFSSVQFSHSVMSDSSDPMDCSTPDFPVHHQLPELIQTHPHRVSDAIQPSHPLSSLFLDAFQLWCWKRLLRD